MVYYITYNNENEAAEKLIELTDYAKNKNLKYGVINMNSLLSDFVKLAENDTKIVIVADLDRMGNILKNAIAPLIKNLIKTKEVYIIVSESEYKEKETKLLKIDNE